MGLLKHTNKNMDISDYLTYPAIIKENDGVFLVEIKNDGSCSKCFDTFYTEGASLENAIAMAQDCILTMVDGLIKEREMVPGGKVDLQNKTHLITLKYHQAIKIMLRNLMIQERYRPVDICKKLNISSQKLNQILDLYKSTNIDDLAMCFDCINKPLKIGC